MSKLHHLQSRQRGLTIPLQDIDGTTLLALYIAKE